MAHAVRARVLQSKKVDQDGKVKFDLYMDTTCRLFLQLHLVYCRPRL